MKSDSYIINSPNYPSQKDFEKFTVWCAWEDSEDMPYIQSLCSSDDEFHKVVIAPYEEGKETYYPILNSHKLPDNRYLLVGVNVMISDSHALEGYVSISDCEIVSITVWVEGAADNEITIYSSDRMFADEDNPKAIRALTNLLKTGKVTKIAYSSRYKLSNGKKVKGTFEWK